MINRQLIDVFKGLGKKFGEIAVIGNELWRISDTLEKLDKTV